MGMGMGILAGMGMETGMEMGKMNRDGDGDSGM